MSDERAVNATERAVRDTRTRAKVRMTVAFVDEYEIDLDSNDYGDFESITDAVESDRDGYAADPLMMVDAAECIVTAEVVD